MQFKNINKSCELKDIKELLQTEKVADMSMQTSGSELVITFESGRQCLITFTASEELVFFKSEANPLIQTFMNDAFKFGYKITPQHGKYMCEFVCGHCGKTAVEEISVDEVNGKIQANIPFYCEECKTKLSKE